LDVSESAAVPEITELSKKHRILYGEHVSRAMPWRFM
jgi:hypothetical protein